MAKSFIDTPLMRQYMTIKAKHPDALLLFRVGDFYETYMEDAPIAAKILGITLTQRSGTNPELGALAGFPYHALDTYLPKLVRAGLRVAVCDQLEDPKTAKGIVKRGITELVTPGVALSDGVLDIHENNFLCAVNLRNSREIGIAFLDITTGEFMMGQGNELYVDRLLATFRPKEILFEKGKRQSFVEAFGSKRVTYPFDDWAFVDTSAKDRLLKHFGTQSLKGFGVEDLQAGVTAAGAIMYYLDVTEHNGVSHIGRLQRIDEQDYVGLDRYSIRNLELFSDGRDGTTSLSDIIDRSTTPMGSRLLKRWLTMPLRDRQQIEARQDIVEQIVGDSELRDNLTETLKEIGDLERLVGKIAARRIMPRELLILRRALNAIPKLKELTGNDTALGKKTSTLTDCTAVADKIGHTISPEPPTTPQKPGVIGQGVSKELDELRDIATSGKDYLDRLQQKLIDETGITSLKVGYTNVYGYYLEVRNTHKDKVPPTWVRKQTLTGAERYVDEELKALEEKIVSAESQIAVLELQIYTNLIEELGSHLSVIQANAVRIAEIDVLHTFARNAIDYEYCKPKIVDADVIDIKGGRHPVIERLMKDGEEYVSNDVRLDKEEQQIVIVTGPNMAGKSALLRQTALIVLLAQCGSYIPAEGGEIGIVDKIFTRVGANDNLSQGESTFMVEMTEAANILNNATTRSLVLFDELGRGTSTYDGISLAWAIVEYLHNSERARAKTLFATHYHELNDMENMYDRIKNYNVSVREAGGKVIFLRKLVRGGSEHSFGIHVAKLAGMPRSVVDRAGEILTKLEKERDTANSEGATTTNVKDAKPSNKEAKKSEYGMQLSFFQLDDPVLMSVRDAILNVDIDRLTPLEALNKLNEIKRLL